MSARLLTGPEAARVLQRYAGRCAAHPQVLAERALVGPRHAGGTTACHACLVAMRLVVPSPEGQQATLLPEVRR